MKIEINFEKFTLRIPRFDITYDFFGIGLGPPSPLSLRAPIWGYEGTLEEK